MKVVTTLDGKTVCNVASWPPTVSVHGTWELAVQGESFLFDLLSDYCGGYNLRVGEFEFRNLLFIRRKAFSPGDEMEFPTMIFADMYQNQTGLTPERVQRPWQF